MSIRETFLELEVDRLMRIVLQVMRDFDDLYIQNKSLKNRVLEQNEIISYLKNKDKVKVN